MSELHNNAEAFVLCALAEDTSGKQQQNQDVATFLLSLILEHKKGQRIATQANDSELVKIEQVVALNNHGDQALAP